MVLVGLAAGLVACGDLSFMASVEGRRLFVPPSFYLEWWTATEACSGIEAQFDRISWFLASGISGDGMLGRARWSPPHEIVIVASYEHDELVVRHEMLHDLLGGDSAHRRSEWDRCGLRFE